MSKQYFLPEIEATSIFNRLLNCCEMKGFEHFLKTYHCDQIWFLILTFYCAVVFSLPC